MTGSRRPGEPEGPGVPPTARLGHGNAQRVRAEIVAILAVGLVVVALGLGLGGPPEDPISSPGPSEGAVASGSGRATSSPDSSPDASAEICRRVDPADPPRLELWSTSDDRNPVAGIELPPLEPLATPVGPWPVPALSGATLLPEDSASLVVFAARNGCLLSVEASVGPADAADPGTAARELDLPVVALPDDAHELGGLPEGDWVVRVVATFAAEGDPGERTRATTTFFRVVSGPITELVPSPQVTPAVACPADPIQGVADLVLVVGDGVPIPWHDQASLAPVPVRLGEPVEIRSIGDACARSWSVAVLDQAGNSFLQESYPNPIDNPFEAAQNRWRVTQLLLGETTLQATVGFGRNREVRASWVIDVTVPPLPAVVARGPRGEEAALLPGCGQYWDVGGAGSAFEPCDLQTVPTAIATLEVRDGDVVRLESVDGAIREWGLRCGDAVPGGEQPVASGGPTDIFVTRSECNLGEGSAGTPAAFLPWAGEWVVFAGLAFDLDGVTAYGNYFVRLIVVP